MEKYSALRSFKQNNKHRLISKFNIKRILKKPAYKRKFPRSTREHTEFDKYPYETTCPNCLSYIETKIYHFNTGVTHAIAASLIPVCLCMIPYCSNEYKNTAHYCPRCKIYLGTNYGKGRNIFFLCATN
ncbi:uncharacterized protein LOC143431760 [Xylocopa sonorina]|uniref:uncharacterized protein LOC143431741 n=1 Tax=Xylocopa sonorina TaxID=1818115 RepID=UPI00403A84F5